MLIFSVRCAIMYLLGGMPASITVIGGSDPVKRFFNFVTQTLPKIISAVLLLLIYLSLMDVRQIQGVSTVINYTGMVRGLGQRIVKQEIQGIHADEHREELVLILDELRNGGETHDITPLKEQRYQHALDSLTLYVHSFELEIEKVRLLGAENTDIEEVSEKFYTLADEAVQCADDFASKITEELASLQTAMFICCVLIASIMLISAIWNKRLAVQNAKLANAAYLDKHTGIFNKTRCEEMIYNPAPLDFSTAFVMCDVNDLKKVNDSMGHQAGDDMLRAFAQILRKSVGPEDFVGRFGGDEFVVILRNVTPGDVDAYLEKLARMTMEHNASSTQFMKVVRLSYAVGYAHSAQVENANMASLLRIADKRMYENKAAFKAARAAKGANPDLR